MTYKRTVQGRFESRPNRFIAWVDIDGKKEKVHVKNTGRCKELLVPGAKVILEESDKRERKTRFDLVCVYKEGIGWINMDSQAPNKVVREWLEKKDYDVVKPEYRFGQSRIDFYMEKNQRKYLMEVKGCTLEIDGIGFFPDAPTARGAKHLREMAGAVKAGYEGYAAFVIQIEGVSEVRANEDTDGEFARALAEAKKAGVRVIFFLCRVTEKTLEIVEEIVK